jgi:mRNA interferase MazF
VVKAGQPRQGGIWLVALDPTRGSEIRKTRPCVVVSPNEMNDHIATVIVVPLTTTIRAYPSRVRVHLRGKVGQAALDQIRTVDKTRLVKKLGDVSGTTADDIAGVLVEMFQRNQPR